LFASLASASVFFFRPSALLCTIIRIRFVLFSSCKAKQKKVHAVHSVLWCRTRLCAGSWSRLLPLHFFWPVFGLSFVWLAIVLAIVAVSVSANEQFTWQMADTFSLFVRHVLVLVFVSQWASASCFGDWTTHNTFTNGFRFRRLGLFTLR